MRRVGVVYDERMCSHECSDAHPEQPDRIRAIWNKLDSSGILHKCVRVDAREATDDELEGVHEKRHVKLIKNISNTSNAKRRRLAASFNSVFFSAGSSLSAFLAAGSLIQVTEKVASGALNSGVAIVRPPGHHAEVDKPMGFCLFNNVAIAAKHLLCKRPELGVRKILIVDWDVHHGNGTQNMFWKDPRVLYFSVHRFDSGTFYPIGDDGSFDKIGGGPGKGYNINIPWEHGKMGDADYLAVWDHVLLPVAKSYDPQIILISGGFDAAYGDPLGGCCLTPIGYSLMTRKLMDFASGKIVLALEGGYNLKSLANSFLACIEALLQNDHSVYLSKAQPFKSTWHVIEKVRKEICSFWPVLCECLPLQQLLSAALDSTKMVDYESSDESSNPEEDIEYRGLPSVEGCSDIPAVLEHSIEGIMQPLASLNVNDSSDCILSHPNNRLGTDTVQTPEQLNEESISDCNSNIIDVSPACSSASDNNLPIASLRTVFTWRDSLSSTYVWYACYGSNMWAARFLCYIVGGKVEGMDISCCGSMDKTPPRETQWRLFPYRLFFGRRETRTWGPGGVAFLHPKKSDESKSHIRLYKITLVQFNDLLAQENEIDTQTDKPLFGLHAIDSLKSGNAIFDVVKDSWYGSVAHVGDEGNVPILTITCSEKDIEKFESGELPVCRPSARYLNTLARGLVDDKGLSKDEAIAYLEAACGPLLSENNLINAKS